MFNFDEFSINENLAPSIGDYILVNSSRGNYYRHKESDAELDSSWIIESDGFISVIGNVNYSDSNIKYIPFLFKKVSVSFECWGCTSLISLEGCPSSVGGYFNCGGCTSLTSLEGCPVTVGGYFSCWGCTLLTSLEGCPVTVGGYFSCVGCKTLTSLKGCPITVWGNFSCIGCTSLTSLEGCPKSIRGIFSCSNCKVLISLEGCPSSVGEDFNCMSCESLTSIDYFKCFVKKKINTNNNIKSGLVTIQNLLKQYSLLSKIDDYALFVHTVIGYAPELKQYYREIPELPEHHQDLSIFL